MRNLKHITSFVFGEAHYHLQSKTGEEVLLVVHYKKNYFEIKSVSGIATKAFLAESGKIAKDLLSRKHAVNFANK